MGDSSWELVESMGSCSWELVECQLVVRLIPHPEARAVGVVIVVHSDPPIGRGDVVGHESGPAGGVQIKALGQAGDGAKAPDGEWGRGLGVVWKASAG